MARWRGHPIWYTSEAILYQLSVLPIANQGQGLEWGRRLPRCRLRRLARLRAHPSAVKKRRPLIPDRATTGCSRYVLNLLEGGLNAASLFCVCHTLFDATHQSLIIVQPELQGVHAHVLHSMSCDARARIAQMFVYKCTCTDEWRPKYGPIDYS